MADVRFVLRPGFAGYFKTRQGGLGEVLLRVAQDVERRAKQFAPVDTGRLRSSITSTLEEDGKGVYSQVGTDVEYAAPVEFGTYRMAAQSFMRRALDEVARNV